MNPTFKTINEATKWQKQCISKLSPNAKKYLDDLIKYIDKIKQKCQPYINELKTLEEPMLLLRGRSDVSRLGVSATPKIRTPKDSDERITEIFNKVTHDLYGIDFRTNHILYCTANKQHASSYQHNLHAVFPIGKFEFLYSNVFPDFYESDLYMTIAGMLMGSNELEDVLNHRLSPTQNVVNMVLDQHNDFLNWLEKQGHGINVHNIRTEYNNYYHDTNKQYEQIKEFRNTLKILTNKYLYEYLEYLTVQEYKYTTKNLKEGMRKGNEIMVHCKSYYFINFSYISQHAYSTNACILTGDDGGNEEDNELKNFLDKADYVKLFYYALTQDIP